MATVASLSFTPDPAGFDVQVVAAVEAFHLQVELCIQMLLLCDPVMSSVRLFDLIYDIACLALCTPSVPCASSQYLHFGVFVCGARGGSLPLHLGGPS